MESTTEKWSYYLLMGSLPPLPPTFEVGRLPISRARLEERLAGVPSADRAVIERMQEVLFWERQTIELTDDDVISRHRGLLNDVSNPVVREIANFRMDLRSIVSALRRRRMGHPGSLPIGQWQETMRRSWADPNLGLGVRFPWVVRLDKCLAQEEVEEAHRIILGVAYRQWSDLATKHRFSFEALALYVARLDVIDRWVSRSMDIGRERLEQLVTEAIGDYRRLF